MLVEKYRPKTWDDIIGHARILEKMKGYVVAGDMPNLLLYGKPGVGKTASALVLANELGIKGQDLKILNASDERGIDTVRTTVKNFAQTMSSSPTGWKILIMDEADSLTKQAQNALRPVMERYHKSVRFIMIGNNIGGFSKALQSRCEKMQFRAVHASRIRTLLVKIEQKEGIILPGPVNEAITKVVSGDVRDALNILEGLLTLENPTPEDVYEAVGTADSDNVFRLMGKALKGDMAALKTANSMLDQGATADSILSTMYFSALKGGFGPVQSDRNRLIILETLGMIPGATDKMRLQMMIAKIIMKVKPPV